jgi:hypothetical protein
VVIKSFSPLELPPPGQLSAEIVQGFQQFLGRLAEEDLIVARIILSEQLRHPEAGRLAQVFLFYKASAVFLQFAQ